MTYQDFRKEYKSVLSKHYDTSNLYNMEGITEKVERFEKRGSRWIQIESTEKSVSYKFYFNVFSSIQFMRNLGGYERTEKKLHNKRLYTYKTNQHITRQDEKNYFFFQF